MKTITVTGRFDPLSQSELDRIIAFRKQGYQVRVVVCGQGILSIGQRVQLVKAAIQPWKHVYLDPCAHILETTDVTDEAAEAHIRSGYFRKCARGTRRLLLENGWYLNEVVDAQCNPHRALHSKSVAAVCADLARANGVDPLLAWRSGMLHDITKRMSDDEGRKILGIYEPDKLEQNTKIWHSYTAVYWLKHEMGLYDPRILQAIHSHTVGDGHSKLDWIVYIADKCEPTRGYDSSRELALSKTDLKAAAQLVQLEAKRYREEEKEIHAGIIKTGGNDAG